MSKLIIKAIMGVNRSIGVNGKMPWHIKEDLKDFKETTMGKPMIMGRKTFESLHGILPNRQHVVITRNKDFTVPAPHITACSLEDAIEKTKEHPTVYIIGGGEIYEQSLEHAHEIDLTMINKEYPADSFFPSLHVDQWEMALTVSTDLGRDNLALTKMRFIKRT